MNKHLLKIFLVLSLFLCLGIDGCDDDDIAALSICGNFEKQFGSFEERREYSSADDGAVFFGTCQTFSCTDAVIDIDCQAAAGGSFEETCNSTEYSLSGAASVTADMTIDASNVIIVVQNEEVTVDGEVTVNIDDLTLAVSLIVDGSPISASVACSGNLIYDNFEDGTLSCDNADISCNVTYNGQESAFDCEAINAVAQAARSTSDRAYCSASESAGQNEDLVELALMKIEEAVKEREEESSEE